MSAVGTKLAPKPAGKAIATTPAAKPADGPVYLRLSRRDSKFIVIRDRSLFTDDNMVTPTRFESKDAAFAWAQKNGQKIVAK